MEIRSGGVRIACGNCSYVAMDERGGFEVEVPVATDDGNLAGTARLRCIISPDRHDVELAGWEGAARLPDDTAEDVRRRVADALEFVAQRKICGSLRICPAAVVKAVSESGPK